MSLKSLIADPSTGRQAFVVDGEDINALAVATRPLKKFYEGSQVFLNETYGVDMNQNAAPSGTPLLIHDGTDTVAWTASAIGGIWDFASTDQAHTGTKSIDATLTIEGDVAQFAKGSTQSLSSYASLSLWIYVEARWLIDEVINIYGWNTGTASIVGNAINLTNYFNPLIITTWQQLSIPLEDMGLVGADIDAIRIEYTTRSGGAADYYVDDMQFEQPGATGGPIIFRVKPLLHTWLYIESFKFSLSDSLDTTLADNSMFNLDYEKILGVSELGVGLVIQIVQNEKTTFTVIFQKLGDLLTLPRSNITNTMCNGTSTFLTIESGSFAPTILKAETGDEIKILISDDLSGLDSFRTMVGAYYEKRNGL